jgi:hypothetical protein
MKNYFALQNLVSVEADCVVHVFFNGKRETRHFNPVAKSREHWLKLLDCPKYELSFLHDDDGKPLEQPSFKHQLAQAKWTATPDQISEWNKRAEKFYRQNFETVDKFPGLTNLPIEELERRIAADGDDTVACIYAAKKLIREDAARVAGPHVEEFATAAFVLWRQGEIAICTDRDGALGYYKPFVQ